MEFVHLFATSASKLKAKLKSYRTKIVPAGVIWVSWPKKSSGVKSDITEDTIRDVALPMGLVDIKVCAVDEVWSGLKLVIRRTERTGSARASRAGDGALAIANFPAREHCGEAPQ